MRLKDKVSIITGAGQGIGKATALKFAQEGAKVICCDINPSAAHQAAADIQAAGGEAMGFMVDVTKKDTIKAMVDAVVAKYGRIDTLVNNAGITQDAQMKKMTEDQFDQVIEVNLKGAWNFLKAGARPLMKCKGRVVNITSVVGITGNAGQANYAASKAGLIGFTRSVAKEYAGRGVLVNCVAPGFIDTDMTAALPEAARSALLEAIPLGRLGSPVDVAGAILFLASDLAAYVTGQTVIVDGGMTG